MGLFIFFTIVIVILIGGVIYSNLLAKKNGVIAAISSLDLHHKKRYQMITDILNLINDSLKQENDKAFIKKLRDLSPRITETYDRTNTDNIRARVIMFQQLDFKTAKLLALVETLESVADEDEAIDKAVNALKKTKRKLDDEIEFFNDAVDDLNSAIESFPGSMIAEYAKADSLAHYEENTETEDDDSES